MLKDYQEEAVNYLLKNPYAIVALEQGLGKCLVALTLAHRIKARTLVVCPAYLRLMWEKEVKKWYPSLTISIFESADDLYFPWDSDIVVISYELLGKAEQLFRWCDLLICDESHKLKNMTAKVTEAAHRYIFEYSIKRVALLTGTPLKNRVHEFYSLIAICNYNPELEESAFLNRYPSFIDFANHFSFLKEREIRVGKYTRTVQQWEGLQNEAELRHWLKGIYIRKTAAEVLDLPESVKIDVEVSESNDLELLEAFNTFIETESGVTPQAKAKAAMATVPFTIKYVESLLEETEKVVVYTDHVESCEAIAKGLGVTAITGKTTIKNRELLKERFQNGDAKVLVATIGSFSTGQTLTASNHIVFNDIPWVPGDLEQAYFRIKRIGQTKTCFFHHIHGSPQNAYILQTIQRKAKTINRAINF